jgi:hypothetical protein
VGKILGKDLFGTWQSLCQVLHHLPFSHSDWLIHLLILYLLAHQQLSANNFVNITRKKNNFLNIALA